MFEKKFNLLSALYHNLPIKVLPWFCKDEKCDTEVKVA